MGIFLKKAGLLTTVQDLGRFGHRRFGINPNGVMDRTAARIVNILIGNDEHDAVLEMHFPAAEIVFEKPCVFAIGGAELTPQLDGLPITNWCTHRAETGGTLRFRSKQKGNRAYLAVQGGLCVDEWLGSKSTNLAAAIGGFAGRVLQTGDRIETNAADGMPWCDQRVVAASLIPHYSRFPTVRVIPGAEFELLTDASRETFSAANYSITNNSNRMGFRLNGEPLALAQPLELVSSAVSFGTIQLLPDGQMIVLMADHQTSGGYPRIANVIERDLPVLGQLGGGDSVAFHPVSLSDAELLAVELEHNLAKLKVGVALAKSLPPKL